MTNVPTTNVTVVGAQWGDEGKGKIIDWPAGHTIAVGDETYKFALLAGVRPRIAPYLRPVAWRLIEDAIRSGKRVLFEGAQAAMLDVDHGTYPYATSSNTVAGQVAAGVGMTPGAGGSILGIVKAYTTRVGEGPFPTELDDATGERLSRSGAEFGTNTGRKRRGGSITSRRGSARRNAWCRSTRRWRDGPKAPGACAHGRDCRVLRPPMCGASRRWSARRSSF